MRETTSYCIPLGNRQYRREYKNIHTGEIEYYEVVVLKRGRFFRHNLNGPAYVEGNLKRWYKDDIEFPHWVPVVMDNQLVYFEDEKKEHIKTDVDKSLILRTTLEFDRDYGKLINDFYREKRKDG